jgi:hypothetical protein
MLIPAAALLLDAIDRLLEADRDRMTDRHLVAVFEAELRRTRAGRQKACRGQRCERGRRFQHYASGHAHREISSIHRCPGDRPVIDIDVSKSFRITEL